MLLPHRSAIAVLGDDVVHVAAAGDDAAPASSAAWMRLTVPPFAVDGSAMIELAAAAARGAAHEVDLAADAGEELARQRVGGDLAR